MKLWQGVLPAITTEFNREMQVDHGFLTEHCHRMIAAGCSGVVALGSLGEGATLTTAEKQAILRTAARAVEKSGHMIAGISALSTLEAAELARMAQGEGCGALMVLPPYVYTGDWREMKAHVSTVIRATPLSCMLYNNPVAYGTDFLPEQIQELAREHANLHAVKESSTDVRRVTAIRALCGDRLQILAGVDDMVIEGAAMGAVGWIAGLANAMPAESVALFNSARDGRWDAAFTLNRWLLPLLRMDTVPKFVQLIKLIQQEGGFGHARVRAPRMELVGAELEEALRVIHAVLKDRDAHRSLLAATAGGRTA